jgi:hypothetical protein
MEGNVNRNIAITILAVMGALILAGVAYQVGVGQGLATTGLAPSAEAVRYGYHPGWGFGLFPLFGLLFPLLFIFLIFGLVRAAFGGPRRWNGGPWMDRQTMAEEWHRKMHADTSERRGDSGTSRPSA